MHRARFGTRERLPHRAEAKAHLSELVARAGTEHERITVAVHGRPTAELLAVGDLEALEEAIAVLSDPALLRSLGEADGYPPH